MQLVSSQVSRLGPRWRARWTHERRLQVAWNLLPLMQTDGLISHRFGLSAAADAYALLDEQPAQAMQILLRYDDAG